MSMFHRQKATMEKFTIDCKIRAFVSEEITEHVMQLGRLYNIAMFDRERNHHKNNGIILKNFKNSAFSLSILTATGTNSS